LIITEILSELSKKGIFLELVILTNLLITWKDKVDIQSTKLSSEELEAIYATEGTTHFIGWDSDSMALKLLSTHLQP